MLNQFMYACNTLIVSEPCRISPHLPRTSPKYPLNLLLNLPLATIMHNDHATKIQPQSKIQCADLHRCFTMLVGLFAPTSIDVSRPAKMLHDAPGFVRADLHRCFTMIVLLLAPISMHASSLLVVLFAPTSTDVSSMLVVLLAPTAINVSSMLVVSFEPPSIDAP